MDSQPPRPNPQHPPQPPPAQSTSRNQPLPPNNIYAFSVHQPYASWPHHSQAPYAAAWYPMPHAYNHTYKEAFTQTVESDFPFVEEEVPPLRKSWDSILTRFLASAGLRHTLRGFELDMLVMNEDWEKGKVPPALQDLANDISALESQDAKQVQGRPLEERKLDYTSTRVQGVQTQTPTTMIKHISHFLAESRRRNDASNRKEFLLSATERQQIRQQVGVEGTSLSGDVAMSSAEARTDSSCARTDARPLDRDVQMKYDIAKNEDGPLKKTMKSMTAPAGTSADRTKKKVGPSLHSGTSPITLEKHPGLAERFENLENHLSVKYVPSPPLSLLDRIKFLEDYIIRLEKEFPPWAALHFNQPNRGWPPPPRATPLIVPSYLTSHQDNPNLSDTSHVSHQEDGKRSKLKGNTKVKSSLQRAVMERLEVKNAMSDLGTA